ncbi:hypothetical protein ACIBI4_04770 [Streptomyces sp. NPDC050418]|uniref:hypothetical protein n=1 Tax=Streptomyces sp. NPDC050418 TaxID=3365612 RepID=UPI0037A418D1
MVRLVGRRAALRYLAVGTVAAAVSACGGNDSPAGGPKAQALKAYAVGDWEMSSTAGREGTITVNEDGTWSETVIGGLSGKWQLDKKGLTVTMDGIDSEEASEHPYFLPDVPDQKEPALSGRTYALEGGWSSDFDGKVSVSTKKDQVILTFPDAWSGEDSDDGVVVTLSRAA